MQKKHKPILPYDSPDGQPYEELYGVASSTCLLYTSLLWICTVPKFRCSYYEWMLTA